jgi:Fe-S-cluster-containing dehydrogenase component
MPRYGIAINSANCMACYNCFIACKDEHCGFATAVSAPQPHVGHQWLRIVDRERGDDTRRIKTSSVPIPCSHCADPACLKAARNGAVYRRPDGIVIIDPERSKGQKAIVDACPIGAVYWNEELGLPQKCTMCAHLLDNGYAAPRCVEACPNDALYFGDLDDPASEISLKIKQNTVTQLEGLVGRDTAVVHLNIPTVFLAGSIYLPGDEVAAGITVTARTRTTGEVRASETNYFGDWEFEGLERNVEYDITVEHPGYRTITLSALTDADRYVGEFILEKE